MALDARKNFVNVSVSGTYTSSDTTISVDDASSMPDPATSSEYNVVFWNSSSYSQPGADPNVEIVRVTSVDFNNNDVTVERGKENTSAVDHSNSGLNLTLTVTSKMIDDVEDVTNLDANVGTNGQVLKSDGSTLVWGEDSSGMTTSERGLVNDIVSQLARNDFADNLDEMGYDGGFFDIFRDESKISSKTDVSVSTLSGGDTDGKINIGQTNILYDGFEDGDYSSSPAWETGLGGEQTGGSATVQSSTAVEGSNALEITTDGQGDNANFDLIHDRGSGTASDQPDQYHVWMRCSDTEDQANHTIESSTSNFFNPQNGIRVVIKNSSGVFQLITTDGSENDLTKTTFGSASNNTWYKFIVTLDVANTSVSVSVEDINGNEVASQTGDITDAYRRYVWLSCRDINNSSNQIYFDDVFYDKANNTVTSGSLTSTQFDLANDGFSNPPDSVVVSQDADIPADEDIQYVISDSNGNSVTVTQADVESEVDLSSFTSTQITIKPELSSSDGNDTPTLREYMAHFKEGS